MASDLNNTEPTENTQQIWLDRFESEIVQVNISDLLDKTIIQIVNNEDRQINILLDDGTKYTMYHEQDCCEGVRVEDITGDLEDLLNTPITMAVESTNINDMMGKDLSGDSFTWTFYKLATLKGYVDIRWLGVSNGYYSESITIIKEVKNK